MSQEDIPACLGNYGSSENPCGDCELREICKTVVKKDYVRDLLLQVLDDSMAEIEE